MYDIKKNLKVTGKVQFKRQVIIQILSEVLQSTEELVLERAIVVDESGNPVNIDSIICYVHQTKSDEIPDKFDPAMTVNMKKGFSRPNYGIGTFIKTLLADGQIWTLDEIYKEAHLSFPKLTKKVLKSYLTRPSMVGNLDIVDDHYCQKQNESTTA